MFDFLSKKFTTIFRSLTGNNTLSEKNINAALTSVEEALLEADIPYNVVQDFIADIQKKVLGKKVLTSLKPEEQFIGLVKESLTEFLSTATQQEFSPNKKSIIMMMGLQGSGKTTSIAKLATHLKNNKQQNILFASVDFYRPAAIDQLKQLASQTQCAFYTSEKTNPVEAAQDIVDHFKAGTFDVLFLDTAGRLHIDNTLLKELQDIDLLAQPQHKILVLDAMTGQESLRVAQAFEQAIGFDGAILTKVDSDTRGGAAFSFAYTLHKPILFCGTGEKIQDLEQFKPERMANRMLGMGDLASLAEKAEKKIQQSEQERMEHAFKTGNITLEDFAQQMNMMNRLGSLSSLIKFMPGAGSISKDQISQGERQMKVSKAIISSMTRKEKINPKILNKSRKQRIARGSGVAITQIDNLLKQFEQMRHFVKLFKKMGRFPGF